MLKQRMDHRLTCATPAASPERKKAKTKDSLLEELEALLEEGATDDVATDERASGMSFDIADTGDASGGRS